METCYIVSPAQGPEDLISFQNLGNKRTQQRIKMASKRSSGVLFLWLAFFLSGIAGLSYELTWVRYLTHLFGASTPAVSATVSIFFGGLALGAALGGWLFDKFQRPLRAYAFLEFLIGVSAASVPFLFRGAELLLTHWHLSKESTLLFLALSTALLIIPTTLLGATFPAMAAVLRGLDNPIHSTGFFYGFNTLGAVVGSLLVSFWWLPSFGENATTWGMTGINFFITFMVLLASRSTETVSPTNSKKDDTEKKSSSHEATTSPSEEKEQEFIPFKFAAILAMTTGFLSIGTEVLWTRALALIYPASVYIFALVLAAYLVGIGLGSLWVGQYSQKNTIRRELLLKLYLLIALGSLIALYFFPKLLPWTINLLNRGILTSTSSFFGVVGLSTIAAMLLATLTMGAALPLLIGLATKNSSEAGRIAGRLYALNTIGGVFGSIGMTFIVMPWQGLTLNLFYLLIAYVLLALIFAFIFRVRRPIRILSLMTFFLLALMLLTENHPQANPLKYRPHQRLLFYRDASSATVAIYEDRRGSRSLRINNYYGLSETAQKTTAMQYRFGLIPLLLHPHPKRTLLIGFATGATLASIAAYTQKQADCVELHGLLLQLAPYFRSVNQEVWNHPKVHLFVKDGRRFLLESGPKYDVIIGDLYLPRNPGVGSLYSLEHFRAAAQRLKQDGLFVTWLPLFQLGPRQTASIIRTFLQVFPYAEGWVGNWSIKSPVIGLFGTLSPEVLTPPPHFEKKLQQRLQLLMSKVHRSPSNPKLQVRSTPPPRYQQLINRKLKAASQLKKWVTSQPTTRTSQPHLPTIPQKNVPSSFPTSRPILSAKNSPPLRRLLTKTMLQKWADHAPINQLNFPYIEFSSPKTMMNARLHKNPLAFQNIRTIARLRSLKNTPWQRFDRHSSSR